MLASTSAINAHYGKYSCKYTKNMLMHYFVAIIFICMSIVCLTSPLIVVEPIQKVGRAAAADNDIIVGAWSELKF